LVGSSGGAFSSSPAGLSISNTTGQITPSSSTAGTYTVSYTIGASGGCSGVTATTSVTITNSPNATISYTGSPFCSSGNAVNVNLVGTSGGAFSSSPAGLSISNTTGQITPSSSTAGTYTVSYTIAASGGCSGVTATTSVTITNAPSATISYAGSPFCSSGNAVNVNLVGSSGGAFSSSPAGLSISNTTGQITPNSSTAGTYTVSYTIAASGGCSGVTATTSVTIIESQAPTITPPSQLVVCSPNTLTLTASGCPGTVNWSNGASGTSLTLTAIGTYSISATCNVNGCISAASATINGLAIVAPPTASASNTGPYSVGQTISLNASGGTSYNWSGPNSFTSTAQNPTISNAIATMSGVYTVSVSNGVCTATATTNVTVTGVDPCTQIVDYQFVRAGNPYQTLFSITDGMTIQQVPFDVSILAVPICPTLTVESVDMTLVGPNMNWTILQSVEPFAMFDNSGLNVFGRNLIPGTYTMTVVGYAQDNRAGGIVYGPITTTFTITGNSASISMPTVANQTVCGGSAIDVSFTTVGTFDVGNQFQVQLSDATGSFGNPTTIGISTSAGTVTCQLPQNTVEGGTYFLRVASSNPTVVSSPSLGALTIIPANRTLTTNYTTGTTTVSAAQKITATNKVISPANVSYQAGKAIELNAGFAADAGTVFKAEIKGCQN
ncbi:MAG: 3-coathanger stack domain-containing protein, partial [Spirosomataceae bacterium]